MNPSNSSECKFSICSDLTDISLTLSLLGLKKALGKRSIVIYLPGVPTFEDWSFSVSLGGAYKYFGETSGTSEESKTFEKLNELHELLRSGVVLAVSTFDDCKGPIESVVEEIELTLNGFDVDTCEEFRIRQTIVTRNSQASRKMPVPFDHQNVSVLPSGKQQTGLKAQMKKVPGVRRSYAFVKSFIK